MNLLNVVHSYENRIKDIKPHLDQNPVAWREYQFEVGQIIDSVFALCAQYERENDCDNEKVLKMKKFFIRQFRPYFRLGSYNRWVIDKPYGYVGDFYIIDEIYRKEPKTTGAERCLDNYFLETGASRATRNRKEDFKRFLLQAIQERPNGQVRILDIAAGPCRDIKELNENFGGTDSRLFLDCIDHDSRAIEFAQRMFNGALNTQNIQFIQKNAVRLALCKNIENQIPSRYDVIFSTGLFDYLNERVAVSLVRNLRKLLKEDGVMIISNYRDKWSNPSRHYMEWGGDWDILYRTEEEFLDIFLRGGFSKTNLSLAFEPQKIMQYCFVRN